MPLTGEVAIAPGSPMVRSSRVAEIPDGGVDSTRLPCSGSPTVTGAASALAAIPNRPIGPTAPHMNRRIRPYLSG